MTETAASWFLYYQTDVLFCDEDLLLFNTNTNNDQYGNRLRICRGPGSGCTFYFIYIDWFVLALYWEMCPAASHSVTTSRCDGTSYDYMWQIDLIDLTDWTNITFKSAQLKQVEGGLHWSDFFFFLTLIQRPDLICVDMCDVKGIVQDFWKSTFPLESEMSLCVQHRPGASFINEGVRHFRSKLWGFMKNKVWSPTVTLTRWYVNCRNEKLWLRWQKDETPDDRLKEIDILTSDVS